MAANRIRSAKGPIIAVPWRTGLRTGYRLRQHGEKRNNMGLRTAIVASTLLTALAGGVYSRASDAKKDAVWHTEVQAALEASAASGKPVLAFFTGSDWCGPCKALHRILFEAPAFKDWAPQAPVVFLEIDYKAKGLSPGRKAYVDEVNKTYSIGAWPTLLLLGENGKAYGKLEGRALIYQGSGDPVAMLREEIRKATPPEGGLAEAQESFARAIHDKRQRWHDSVDNWREHRAQALKDGQLANVTESWDTAFARAKEEGRQVIVKKCTFHADCFMPDDINRYLSADWLNGPSKQYVILEIWHIMRDKSGTLMWGFTPEQETLHKRNIEQLKKVLASSELNIQDWWPQEILFSADGKPLRASHTGLVLN
jgi:thiol-disulfide isomerase/thioredoxin